MPDTLQFTNGNQIVHIYDAMGNRLYKMVQLYDTYSAVSFSELMVQTDMKKFGNIVPFETAQMVDDEIVPSSAA